MRRLMLFIAIAGAVAYVTAVYQARTHRRSQDEEAVSAWENEGGAPLPEA